MAIVDRTSAQNPADHSRSSTSPNAGEGDGYMKSAQGFVANAADDTAASIHRYVRVPSNANVRSVKLTTGDATTAGAINIGVYRTADDGGALVDADLFASALDLTGGPFVKAEQIAESGQITTAERVQPLWQQAGLASDPGGFLDIAATISTTYNGAAVGQLLEVDYVV
jgi:hypothetical protein